MNASLSSSCPGSPNAFDSDLAGIGSIIYLFTNAAVTMVAVLLAYSMNALPDIEYTKVDLLLIPVHQRRSPKALRRGRRFKPFFEKFLTILADQQLVVSLAILIAVCARWSQTSLYSLTMAWTLATISLVTHMAAIRYCPKYIRASRLLGIVRAFAILIVLSGFIGLMIVLDYAELQVEQLAAGVDAQSAWKMQLSCIFSQPIQTPLSFVPTLAQDTFWCLAAATYYLNILTKLKSRNGEIHSLSLFYRGLVHLFRGKLDASDDYRYIYKSRMTWIKKIKPGPRRFLCERLAEMEAAYLAIKTSVSVDIPWLFFILIYCSAQLPSTWLTSDALFWDPMANSTSLGVGQIMPLIFLIGLLLNGIDAFIAAKPKDTEAALAAVDDTEDTEAARAAENHTEAAGDQQDPDAILKNRWFQRFLYFFSAWNMAVLVYAGIICGGPWDDTGLNWSVVGLIASLFVWEIWLELRNLIMRVQAKFGKHK